MMDKTFMTAGAKRRVGGSVSLELVFILPALLVLMVASSEVLTLFRLEQRLTNLNYNVLELVGNRRTLTRDNNLAQLPYFRDFAEQQLTGIVKGEAGLSVALHNAATKETQVVLADSRCQLSNDWPALAVGSIVKVSLCFLPDDSVRDNAIWALWPAGRFESHMVRETN